MELVELCCRYPNAAADRLVVEYLAAEFSSHRQIVAKQFAAGVFVAGGFCRCSPWLELHVQVPNIAMAGQRPSVRSREGEAPCKGIDVIAAFWAAECSEYLRI